MTEDLVTEVRDSGVELLDTDIDEAGEDVEAAQHFRTKDENSIAIGETAGNPVTVDARYFVAISVDREADKAEQMMTGQDYIKEASVFISNDEGTIGGGVVRVTEDDTDEPTVEAAIEKFESEKL